MSKKIFLKNDDKICHTIVVLVIAHAAGVGDASKLQGKVQGIGRCTTRAVLHKNIHRWSHEWELEQITFAGGGNWSA